MANDTHYGLSVYLSSRDTPRRFAQRARSTRAGSRWIRASDSSWVSRVQAERTRPGELAWGDARRIHASQERDDQPQLL